MSKGADATRARVLPSLRICLGVEDGSHSVAGPVAASWASEREAKEAEAEDVPLSKKGAKLIDDEIESMPRFQVQCSWYVLKLHNTYFGLSRRG